jgi:hypothetical protein
MLKNFDCLIQFYNDKWNKRKKLINEPFALFFSLLNSVVVTFPPSLKKKKENGSTSVQTSRISFQTK